MQLRPNDRGKDLTLKFATLNASDSAQRVAPMRRITQATYETATSVDPYAATGWGTGGDDYTDQATTYLHRGTDGYRRTAHYLDRTAQPRTQPTPTDRYGSSSARYDASSAGYEASSAGYESTGAGYEASSAGYESTGAGYDASSAGSVRPSRGAAYDASGAGSVRPSSSAGYESTGAGYDASGGGSVRPSRGVAYDASGAGSVSPSPLSTAQGDMPLSTGLDETADAQGPLSRIGQLRPAEEGAQDAITPRNAHRIARGGPRSRSVSARTSARHGSVGTARNRPLGPGRAAPGAKRGVSATSSEKVAAPHFVRGRTAGRGGPLGKTARKGGLVGRGALGGSLRTAKIGGLAQGAASEGVGMAAPRVVGLPLGRGQGVVGVSRAVAAMAEAGQRVVVAAVAGLASTSLSTVLLAVAAVVAVVAVIVSFLPWLDWNNSQQSTGGVTGALAADVNGVPAQFIPLYNKAGETCPEIPATLLAAQGARESGFNPNAVSPKGARGIAQFMEPTWRAYGTDANGDGIASPLDPADAIASQARYMCDLVGQVKALKAKGKITGDVQTLALAAYNAGLPAVEKAGGVPPYAETAAYAPAILAAAQAFGGTLTPGSALVTATGDYAGVIATLQARLGTPYSWGGGNVNGPTRGFAQGASTVGWDCSSFMQYGFYQGTGGKVLLPRTAGAQGAAFSAYPVPRNALQPGDLLFWGSSAAKAHHVAMYVGNGQMIEEPHTGLSARITPLRTDFVAAERVPL